MSRAGYFNPGAAALSSPAHTVQSRLYTSGRPWLRALADDMSYDYHAVQAAAGGAVPALSWKGPTRIEAAFYGVPHQVRFRGPAPLERERRSSGDLPQ